VKEAQNLIIKEAISQLIGPTEVAPEVLQLIKKLEEE